MGSSHPPSLSNVATPPPKKTGAYNAVFTRFAQNLRIFFFLGGGVAGGERGNITFELHCSSEARAHCNLKVHHLPLQRNTHLNLFSHDLGTARILRTMANQSAHRHL